MESRKPCDVASKGHLRIPKDEVAAAIPEDSIIPDAVESTIRQSQAIASQYLPVMEMVGARTFQAAESARRIGNQLQQAEEAVGLIGKQMEEACAFSTSAVRDAWPVIDRASWRVEKLWSVIARREQTWDVMANLAFQAQEALKPLAGIMESVFNQHVALQEADLVKIFAAWRRGVKNKDEGALKKFISETLNRRADPVTCQAVRIALWKFIEIPFKKLDKIENPIGYLQRLVQCELKKEWERRNGTLYEREDGIAVVSFDQEIATGKPLLALLPDRRDGIGEATDRLAFIGGCRKEGVPAVERNFLYNKFFKGLTYTENARELGLTPKEVRNIERKYNRGRPGFKTLKKISKKI